MKISKKIWILTGLIVLLFLFKGYIYRLFIKYEPIKETQEYVVSDSKLIDYIESSTTDNDLVSIEAVTDKSDELTNEKLEFTFSKCDKDPNRLIFSLETNCVGYAYFYAVVCNYLLEKSKLSNQWHAKTYRAKLYFLGIDIHTWFNTPFFKDHDFVIIENSVTGEKIYIDPTTSDYLGIDKISIKSE